MTTHDEDKIIAQQARIEQLTNFIKYAQVSSGVCCCGDSMEGHSSPMICGHSPVDMWDYHSGELLEAYHDDLSALRAHDEKLLKIIKQKDEAILQGNLSLALSYSPDAIEKGGNK